MKTLITLLFAFMLLAGLQCPKENNNPPPEPELTLPPITSQGLNTVGCKIDGKVWVPYSKTSFPEFMSSVARFANWRYNFSGYQIDDVNSDNSIRISVGSIINDSLFLLDKFIKDKNFIAYFPKSIPQNHIFITTNPNKDYFKILKLDTLHKIISGIFECTVVDTLTNEKHIITEGRLDLRFEY